jgi:CHAT domain-containing protein
MRLDQQLRKADLRAVALAAPAGVSLVEFVRFDVFDFKSVPARGQPCYRPAHYLAFVLPVGEPDQVRMIDVGEAEPIDQLIADFRSGITGEAEQTGGRKLVKRRPGPVTAPRENAGPRLRAAVFDKLVPALDGRRRLLLAPDGDLTRLPFEVLPAADGRLLIDTYQISYVGCGRDVLRFGAGSTGQPAQPLVVADPDFDLGKATPGQCQPAQTAPQPRKTGGIVGRRSREFDRGKYQFDRLAGTRTEGERIAALLQVQAWLGAAALEGRLKQHCRSPRILHLATHGFFLQDQPHDPEREFRGLGAAAGFESGLGRLSGPLPENPLLRAGLALAGAQTFLDGGQLPPEAEDGLLTAEDVSGLDLLATELVVLSACETGLGEVRTGEGVFGLQRAFVLAGAKTLVMSLWSVPDQETRQLMEDFYQRILSGQPRADALRQAQLALRQKHPDPFYWGAFICQGNPGPLRSASPGR